MTNNTSQTQTSFRPPIVTVLGHVDHGKTSLLDKIRETDVASREHGGITQHIGAYQVDKNGKKITFIDTPGHEAFANMRARGADVADIAILVVAANDGIMPQTKESIGHIKAANIPTIIALNKIDLPEANPEKVKKQLTSAGFVLEEYGGETPVLLLSAKTGQGIDKLLDMILLLSELNQIGQDLSTPLSAIVIESLLSKQKGPTATVIVRNGNLTTGEEVQCDNQQFKIRAIFDWNGKSLSSISAGDPGQLLGWKTVPAVGSSVTSAQKERTTITTPEQKTLAPFTKPEITPLPTQALEEEKVKVIIKADTAGTLEAILAGLTDTITVITSGVGPITESEILLAKTAKALVIGFNQKTSDQVLRLAQSEKVIVKTYSIIYELFQEIEDVVEAIRTGNLVTTLGEAKVLALFPFDGETVAGIKVTKGRIARGDQVRVMRENEEIGRARIKSLKHQKEDITKAEEGTEAGLLLSNKLDFLTGDSIIAIG